MLEPTSHIIVVEDLPRTLLAVKRDILDCEPMAALNRIDCLFAELEVLARKFEAASFIVVCRSDSG